MTRLTGLLGLAVLLALAWLASSDRRAIRARTVLAGLALQFAIALLVLRTPFGEGFFSFADRLASAFIASADAGIEFVFGRWPRELLGVDGSPEPLPFVFAVRVLPVIIFVASVFQVLYHFGIMQRVVGALAVGLRRVVPLSGAEALSTVADVFLGMTEAPLMVRPYVERMTRSELFCMMTAGLATVAGSVLVAYVGMLGPEYAGHLIAASFMNAPAAVVMAKIMVPETGRPETLGAVRIDVPRESVNAIDAAAAGAAEGLRLALNVGAMLIAFVAIVRLLDSLLGWAGGLVGITGLSFTTLLGWIGAPVAWLLGVAPTDAFAVGQLLGVKIVLNEFLAYEMLSQSKGALEPRSALIASYALCGFANFGSLAILLGGIGGMAPTRRPDIAQLALRALLAGALATCSSAAVAGLLLPG